MNKVCAIFEIPKIIFSVDTRPVLQHRVGRSQKSQNWLLNQNVVKMLSKNLVEILKKTYVFRFCQNSALIAQRLIALTFYYWIYKISTFIRNYFVIFGDRLSITDTQQNWSCTDRKNNFWNFKNCTNLIQVVNVTKRTFG